MKKLLIAMPTYDGHVDFLVQAAVYRETSGHADRMVGAQQSSLLANCCNQLYCIALNDRDTYGRFMMWHSDVRTKASGLITGLIQEKQRLKADVISVLLPIKDEKGLTSSGLMYGKGNKRRRRRLTIKEAEKLPETFHRSHLCELWDASRDSVFLVNTGLILWDLNNYWAEKLYFNICDKIVKQPDGKYLAAVQPEDWNLSQQFYDLGLSVWCTRKFEAWHKGVGLYTNQGSWGRWETDLTWEKNRVPEDDEG